jgi:TatD DNase family protein
VHPHHASQLQPQALSALRALLSQREIVAVGECGLDYHRNYSPRAAQLRAFEWQLQLAAECGKPVFLHQRDAHADFMAALRNQAAALGAGVAHCFTGSAAELHDYLDLGLSIGITGWFNDEPARCASARAGGGHPGAAAATRDRRAVSLAARSAAKTAVPS